MKTKIILMGLIALLMGCDQKGSSDSTKERAKAEQEANNEVENNNLAKKAEKMENDLANRHHFYGAAQGEYQGSVQVGDETYNIKFNIVQSIPPYTGDRVRQLSEIENDLNNLFFHIQIVQWHPDDAATAVGCRVSEIKPDMQKGMMTIASSDCPNLYTVYLSHPPFKKAEMKQKAEGIAEKLRGREISEVPALTGYIQPSSVAGNYSFTATRIK